MVQKKEIKEIGLFNEGFLPILDGVTMTVKNYALWLNRKVAPTFVVTPKVPDYVDAEEFEVFRYFSAPVPFRSPYRFGLPLLDFDIYELLLRKDISLVHSHSPFSAASIALKIRQQKNIPVVATFHSKYRENLEAHIPSKLIVNVAMKSIMEWFDQADEVWIPQAKAEETIRSYGFKGKIEVVENGIDLDLPQDIIRYRSESRKLLGFEPAENILLYVGQHIWEKNLKFLLESLGQIKHHNFKALFVGEGYARPSMESMVQELGIQDKIVFWGSVVEREKLKRIYACANLFLFPSFYDTSGLVFREAAALHTPALLIEGATSAEVIQDGLNGYLASNHTDAFSKKIVQILSDAKGLEQTGQIASQTLCKSWEEVVDEVHDRYLQLIRRKAAVKTYY